MGHISEPSSNVIAVAWDERIGDRPAPSGWGQFVCVTGGEIGVVVDGAPWTVAAGHGIWIPANRRLALMQNPEPATVLHLATANPVFDVYRLVQITPLLREAIERIVEWGTVTDQDMDLAPLLITLTQEIRSAWSMRLTPPWPKRHLFRQAADLLVEVGPGELSIEDVAEKLSVCRRTLHRRFVREVGIGVADWRRDVRLTESIRLLFKGLKTDEVARLSGYSNKQTYTYAFYAKYHMTPRGFRLAYGADISR